MLAAIRRVVVLSFWRARIAVRSERERRGLGIFWWILEPALAFLVYWLVFKIGLRAGGERYLESLGIGLMMWRWYEAVVAQGSSSLLLTRNEYLDYPVPKPVYPLSYFLLATWKFLPIFLLLYVALAVTGRASMGPWGVSLLVFTLFAQAAFMLGVALLLSSVVPFVPDLRQTVDFLVRLQFFVSNVVFPLSILPTGLAELARLNPMYVTVHAAQHALLGVDDAANPMMLLYPLALGAVLIVLGGALLKRFSGEYGKISA